MTKSFRTLPALAAIAAGLVAIAAPAAAKESVVVYADLNLATEAGRAELDKRIDRAATAVCKADPLTGSRIRSTKLVRQCIADAKKEIGEQVAARTGESALGG